MEIDISTRDDKLNEILKKKGLKEKKYTEKELRIMFSDNQRKYFDMIIKLYNLTNEEANIIILKGIENTKILNIKKPRF